MDGELGTARHPVFHGNRGAVQFDDALHNRKPKSRTPLLISIAAPEATENKLSFLLRYSRSLIPNADRAVVLDHKLDRCSWRGMFDGVLTEIANRTLHHFGIALDPHRRVWAD